MTSLCLFLSILIILTVSLLIIIGAQLHRIPNPLGWNIVRLRQRLNNHVVQNEVFVCKLCNVKPKLFFTTIIKLTLFTLTIVWHMWKKHYDYTLGIGKYEKYIYV